MLKRVLRMKISSLSITQFTIALLFFLSVAYMFSHVLAFLDEGITCAFTSSVGSCSITYDSYDIIGGISLSFIVCYAILVLLLGNNKVNKRKRRTTK